VADFFTDKLKDPLYVMLPYGMLIFLVWLSFNTNMSRVKDFTPEITAQWDEGLNWIKENTSENDSFIHWWDYGYLIQGVTGRATVSDGGHAQGGDSDYLIGRYLFCAKNLTEVKNVLKNYTPDYLLVISEDIFKFFQISRIGKRDTFYVALGVSKVQQNFAPHIFGENYSRILLLTPDIGAFPVQEDFTFKERFYSGSQSFIYQIILPYDDVNNSFGNLYALVYTEKYGQEIIPIQGICAEKQGCIISSEEGIPGYAQIITNGVIWIPKKASEMFMTHLYLLNREIPGFELVFENSIGLLDFHALISTPQNIRIYKINYDELEANANEYDWMNPTILENATS